MSDWQTRRARELRANMTSAERRLWSVLRDRQVDQFRFRRQMPIGRYVADFVCPTARLVIEIDGGQHGTPTDAARDRWFTEAGFRVLRFWNNEVERNLEGVYRRVQEALVATTARTMGPDTAGSTAAPAPAAPAAPAAESPAPAPAQKAGDDDSPWARARRERDATARGLQAGDERAAIARTHDHAHERASAQAASAMPSRAADPQPPVQASHATPATAESPWRPRPARAEAAPDGPAPPVPAPPVPTTPQRSGASTVEVRIHGYNACLAAFAARPQDLRKVYLLQSRLHALRDVLAWCVQHRLGYRVVEEADLAKLAGSTHHEGLCFDMRRRDQPDLAQLLATLPASRPSCLLWLDGVGNPHNFGAVLRSAAHFGVAGVLLPPGSTLTLSGAAYRVAEGGAEAVPVVRLDSMPDAMQALRAAGFALVATLPRAAVPIHAADLPPRTVFVLGAEGDGMQAALIDACGLRVTIPGTGRVESLNIANAVGVLLSEHWRRHAGH